MEEVSQMVLRNGQECCRLTLGTRVAVDVACLEVLLDVAGEDVGEEVKVGEIDELVLVDVGDLGARVVALSVADAVLGDRVAAVGTAIVQIEDVEVKGKVRGIDELWKEEDRVSGSAENSQRLSPTHCSRSRS